MNEFITFCGVPIAFQTAGSIENPAIVLLHGYLESMEVWEGFVDELVWDFFVVCIDLPGHGKSGVYSKVHRMDDMAEAVFAVMEELKLPKFHLVGHSMGGYVTLAFRESHQDRLLSYVLFHSSCFADNEEKQHSRDEDIKRVKDGRKKEIVEHHVPKTFAPDNIPDFTAEISRLKKIAMESPDEGIIAILQGMKKRPDRCALLKDDIVPLLVITGRKDNFIPVEISHKIESMGASIDLAILERSGHMGFIEEKERSAEILRNFFKEVADSRH